MALYLIGDVQGCFATLKLLLERVGFDPLADEAWLAGDLVNRGPRSLEVLRWAYANRDAVKLVLGNHDVHLVLRYAGLRKAKQRDTLQAVLAAADAETLIDWLRRQPFLLRRDELVMVHAGLHPSWTIDEAAARALSLNRRFAADDFASRLSALKARDAESLAVLTRMRMLDSRDRPDYAYKGSVEDAPKGLTPWFHRRPKSWRGTTLAFGHWAALGRRIEPKLIALDSACVWGRALTAVRYPDTVVIEAANVD